MSSDEQSGDSLEGLHGRPHGTGRRIGIAAGRFNSRITAALVDGAKERLIERGVDPGDITVTWAPGAFELPLVAQTLTDSGFDAVVCLGAVIRGETTHYDFVAGECAAGIQRVALESEIPVIFGVLTTENLDQALARAGGAHGHKGREAADAALEMVDLLRQLRADDEPAEESAPNGPRLYKS
jgi:6,7-dimethyl-8-ribityllumazine synthase